MDSSLYDFKPNESIESKTCISVEINELVELRRLAKIGKELEEQVVKHKRVEVYEDDDLFIHVRKLDVKQ